jgi:hypothetical protein
MFVTMVLGAMFVPVLVTPKVICVMLMLSFVEYHLNAPLRIENVGVAFVAMLPVLTVVFVSKAHAFVPVRSTISATLVCDVELVVPG